MDSRHTVVARLDIRELVDAALDDVGRAPQYFRAPSRGQLTPSWFSRAAQQRSSESPVIYPGELGEHQGNVLGKTEPRV